MDAMERDAGTIMKPITSASASILLILATKHHAQILGHFALY